MGKEEENGLWKWIFEVLRNKIEDGGVERSDIFVVSGFLGIIWFLCSLNNEIFYKLQSYKLIYTNF